MPAATLVAEVTPVDTAIVRVQLLDPRGRRGWRRLTHLECAPAVWRRLRHVLAIGEALEGGHLDVVELPRIW